MRNALLVPVAVAARLLSASEGTIATWLDDGLLREWERAPKRRIVDVKEAFLLCGLRHDLQQVTPDVAEALDLKPQREPDLEAASRLAVAYAEPAGLPTARLQAAIARHLGYGYSEFEIEHCLRRLADYRARHRATASPLGPVPVEAKVYASTLEVSESA
jgi:hypothetical protein